MKTLDLNALLASLKEGTIDVSAAVKKINLDYVDVLIAKKNAAAKAEAAELEVQKTKLEEKLTEAQNAAKELADKHALELTGMTDSKKELEEKIKTLETTSKEFEDKYKAVEAEYKPFKQKTEAEARVTLFDKIVKSDMIEDAYALANSRGIFEGVETDEDKKAKMTEFVKEKSYFAAVNPPTGGNDDGDGDGSSDDDQPTPENNHRHAGLRSN